MGKGARVDYHDPYVPAILKMRMHDLNMKSIEFTEDTIKGYDCIVIATDHSSYDNWIVDVSNLVVDTRGATKGIKSEKITRA
jgi:UDP-N-acetyl-D-glucosamine dehydrogenase